MRVAILVAILAVLGLGACQQKPADNPSDNRPQRTAPR